MGHRGKSICWAAIHRMQLEEAYLSYAMENMPVLKLPEPLNKICKDGLKPGDWTTYAAR